jgi:vitamin B12 transporter
MKKTTLALSIHSALTMSLFISPSFAAQVGTNKLETIIVTANRTPEYSLNALTSIDVITRDEISRASADSVADLLRSRNGIQLTHNGGAGQATSLYTRGTNSGHTLVVIDGQRISSATLGSVDFASLSLEQIERIEIIKGPRAALWGSDAIGGVIQIFTRQPSDEKTNITIALGNDKQQKASISTSLAHGQGATSLTASAQSSQGYDVFDNAEDDKDGFSRENISLNGYQTINTQWHLSWLAKYNQGVSDYDNAFGGANKTAFDSYQWQLAAQHSQDKLNQQFMVGQQQNRSTDYGNTMAKKDGSYFQTDRTQLSWLGSYQLIEQVTTGFGFDLIDESVDTTQAYSQNQRDINAAFIHLAFDDNDFIIDGAFRYDDIEGINSELTYQLSTGIRFAQHSLLSVNIGTGFKAPSFNDLYYPVSAYSYGNPDLQAETSSTVELLLKTKLSNITIEASAYRTIIDNLIEWIPDANFAYSPKNVNQAKIMGTELTLSSNYLGLAHQLQLAYLDATDDETAQPLIRRAKQTASYQLSYLWQQIYIQTGIYYQGEREDIAWPDRITLPSYTLVNLSAHYRINNAWQLGLKINNLLDRNYQAAHHYIGQPAQYLLTVSYKR